MRAVVVVVGILVLVTLVLGYLPPDDEISGKPRDDCTAACAELESHRRMGEADDDADDAGTEVGCGVQCRVDHCSDGCMIWERALNSSCQDVCNVSHRRVTVKELHCTIGCQNAMNQYFQKLKADIGEPPTPVLVEDSLGATSLSLKWENANLKHFDDKVLYFVQWKFEDVEGNWKYCDNQNWNGKNQIFVHNLQPYTRYRFRLAILLVTAQEDDTPMFSQPSSKIMTFSRGPPTSAPVILKALAIDHSRIYINWKPGLFTNGPLFAYVLRLKQEGREAFQFKDVPISQDTFMFQSLDSNTNYSVTLAMRNGDGEGPATSTFVKTLFEPEGNSSETPTLIITSQYSIRKQTDSIDAQKSLLQLMYTSDAEIRDTTVLAAPVSQLFLCDENDQILKVSLKAPNTTSLILEPNTTSLRPWALSADWLNGWLYVAGANDATGFWEISRCDFDGRKLKGLLPGLMDQPIKLEVDPVNGYLFWKTNDSIYRVDLADFEKEPNQAQPELILKRGGLGAFMVDYENTRLFVTYQPENTVKSVSLDGKVVIEVRANTKQPRFNNVSSLSMNSGLFYWTDGEEILAEVYDDSRFYYTVISEGVDNYFMKVHILGTETQPTPYPTLAPTNVQALVLSDRVRISWRAPEPKNLQGRGAWRNWSYALLLEDDVNGELIQEREIKDTEHSVYDLRDHSLYSLKIAAYSAAGDGPWSKEFKVQTFKKELKACILWSTNESLLQSDMTGHNTEILLNNTNLDSKNPLFVSDIDWYKDLLFIVGNNSKIYKYNVTSHKSTLLKHANPSSSVAIEWLTEKIYWADPKKQIIFRSNFDGNHEEPIVFSKVVKNLILDTMEAYLYWSTSRTVEVVRLNGEDRRHYRSEEDFNGRQVAGLTLDQDNRFVYWVVGNDIDDFKLYRSLTADMLPLGPEIVPEMVSVIPSITGRSLAYISNRFFYLASPQEAITGDAYGKYVSSLTNKKFNSSFLTLFVKTTNPPVDSKINKLIVRPDVVEISSIAIEGNWRDFNVIWRPINNTSYGRVFYEVTFVDPINVDTQPVSTTRTSVSYANADRLLPYSLVFVYVRAYTYWDSAPTVSKVLRSPQSVPSQPLEPRIFIESYKDAMTEKADYFATFRWNMPEFENGPVTGFKVRCWFIVDGVEVVLCDHVDVPASKLEYKIHNLQSNVTHFFQVCAKTEIGSGPYSDPVSASTDNENPVPQLLVATMGDVKKVDLDQRTNVTITPHIAVELAHIAAESKIYWINEMQELVTATVEGNKITKILTLNNSALSLCVDWISRSLFWTESSYEEYGTSHHIMKLDLSVWEAGILKFTKILSRSRRIVNLDIAPLTGTLFWIEVGDNESDLGYVIQSDLSGENVQPFFNHTEDCSCPFRPKIKPVFTVDNTEAQSPVIYWISDEGHLNIADIEGCICSHVLEAGVNRGLPPTSLTTDKSYIYWSDMTIHKIHYINKSLSSEDMLVNEYPLNEVRNIIAIGKSLQPYPDSDCLMPQRPIDKVEQIAKTSTSITVRLPDLTTELKCGMYSLPATLYTIDLTECKKLSNNNIYEIDDDKCENDEERIRYQTYWKEFEAKDLKPFTKYRFKLTLANYYSEQELGNVELDGQDLVLRTGAGVPSKPEDVRARPLTPTLAIIDWVPPMFWNAEYVRYKVFWRSTTLMDDVLLEGEKMVRDGDVSTHLESLTPGQEYFVFVRVYPENFTDVYSQSEETTLVMYSEPNNLTMLGATSDAMNVSWVPMTDLILNHSLQYTRNNIERWETASEFTRIKNRLIYMIRNLNSKEYYRFRLVLRYRNYSENFVWPSDGRFTFQTLEDIPTAPGSPTLVNLQNSNYQLRWEPARSHGYQIISYYLEGTIVDSSLNITNEWIPLYNGSENFWGLPQNMHEKYFFRVRARNDYGYGNWSEMSILVDLTEMTRAMVIAQEHLGLILGLCIPIVTIVLLCFCYFLCSFNKKPKEDQKKIPIKMKPKVELATLREIPRGNFIESNALYEASTEADTDSCYLLPKIQREQISLAKFLGSGAFGEVFQGIVRDLEGLGSKTPIAVKTLRKGATPQEKNEFVQEAKLMSHFQHKHVLRLLGVCLDTDPPLLLLELMAGGDLLSYLRTSRSLKPSDPSALRLQDLLSMCEDVARGCRYLEELHFVHRDLACRNCLVSARERENRVVKIGDFGLARDIYKNDYYRKEGEGLLPVRWMAPESLVDGVFTSQSDVWAFGVLMWEITSLGQQPYQARTNLEVLHHVRAGGRLPKPLNCPPRLHQLMLRCWSAVDARPSFKVCLEHIVALRNCTEDTTLSPVNPGQFLVHGNAYKSSHFRDNLSIQSLLQDSESSKPAIAPKSHSWLLDDVLGINESKDPRAAYEIPKSIPVVVENTDAKESRYIEIISNEPNSKQDIEDKLSEKHVDATTAEEEEFKEQNSDCNRVSVTSLNVLDKKIDKTPSLDKRSSTASLGDKYKSADALKQSGSYARLVGNGESVSSLSDWRRVKRIANEERLDKGEDTKSNTGSNLLSYSMVSFPQTSQRHDNEVSKTAFPKLHRTKSNLQTGKANIPLVINSGLLNMLRQAPDTEDEEEENTGDDVNYANIDPENVTVTDL